MKYCILFILLFSLKPLLPAQEAVFRAEVKSTEVEAEEVFRVDFIIKNMRGEFQAPDFTPFKVVGGPNQSSSIQIINGEYFQEYRYTYYLRADEPGFYVIPEATLLLENDVVHSEALEIQIVPSGGKSKKGKLPVPEPDSRDPLHEILKGKKVKKL